jgi:hypothetical protein
MVSFQIIHPRQTGPAWKQNSRKRNQLQPRIAFWCFCRCGLTPTTKRMSRSTRHQPPMPATTRIFLHRGLARDPTGLSSPCHGIPRTARLGSEAAQRRLSPSAGKDKCTCRGEKEGQPVSSQSTNQPLHRSRRMDGTPRAPAACAGQPGPLTIHHPIPSIQTPAV